MALLRLEQVTRTVPLPDAAPLEILKGIDLEVEVGDHLSIVGRSGSGKSTLLNLLGLLDEPSSGRLVFDEVPLERMGAAERDRRRGRDVGFIFQQFNLLPTLTAVQNVEAGHAPLGLPQKELEERSLMMLSEVGLRERAFHLPSQMSGGEQQRVAIARALLAGPRVVLADEPTGNLDSQSGADVITLLTDLAARHGTTIIVATHDAGLAARAPRRLSMHDGHLVGDVKNGKKVKTTKKS
jgi:putative ABC transport system ATP-binding protein